MSKAIKILQGRFGRVALLDMDRPLVTHAHRHCHVLIKASGADTFFSVREESYPLTGTTAVLVNAWEPHAYTHHNPLAPRTVILALYIEPTWLGEIQRQLAASALPQFFVRPCVEISARIRRLADDLAMEMLTADESPPQRLESILFDLMIAVIDPFSQWRNMGSLLRARAGQGVDSRIRKAMNHLQENIGTEVNMDDLASRSHLSRAHFFALFRRCTNLTPGVYANVLRVESAIQRLTQSDCSLSDISYQLGFSAPGHFTRFFQQHLGAAPSEYRRVVEVYGRAKWIAPTRLATGKQSAAITSDNFPL